MASSRLTEPPLAQVRGEQVFRTLTDRQVRRIAPVAASTGFGGGRPCAIAFLQQVLRE